MTDKNLSPLESVCQEAEAKARELYDRQRHNNWKTDDLGGGLSIVKRVMPILSAKE